jgi:carbon-monoxide dehydrogenase medium subunit
MKSAPFNYRRVRSLDEAFGLLATYGDRARILAGGQSLLPALALRLSEPELLIDIGGLDALRFIDERDSTVRIGALARHVDVETSALVAARVPLLAQAMPHVAHPAIRNRGTVGGSLALADPAAELPACMVALDARIVIAAPAGERQIAAADFFRGLYSTALEPGEVLVRVEIPFARQGSRAHFAELARRHGDYAIVGLAALDAPRFVFLGCGDRPARAPAAEAAVRSGVTDYAGLRTALDGDLVPQGDLHATPDMRLHLATVLVQRAAAALAV